jgi:hypothetical protein
MARFHRPIRVGYASGFYGDRASAMRELVEGGPIDVLTGDWLAELTLAILARDRMKDDDTGYAKTFLPALLPILGTCLERGIRVISNAGGIHPHALARQLAQAAAEAGHDVRIAVVDGDDLGDRLGGWMAGGDLRHLESGTPLQPTDGFPMRMHAYLGAAGIAEALEAGADVVITGRTTDAAPLVAVGRWGHGWPIDAWDPIAGALVAGPVVVWGPNATGGNFSGWRDLPNLRHIGFPIAEIGADGTTVITKHPGTGGAVTVDTVKAQLLYEIGHPCYVSPDVVADFGTLDLVADGADRVTIRGVRGSPPPPHLKAGVLLAAGYRNEVQFLLGGADVVARADALGEAFWASVGGRDAFLDTDTSLLRGDHPETPPARALSRLTCSARSADRDGVGPRFTRRAVELALGSVPGVTLDALPGDPKPVVSFWPCLVPVEAVPTWVHLGDRRWAATEPTTREAQPTEPRTPANATAPTRTRPMPLGRFLHARSGDKAGNANVGFWARDPIGWDELRRLVTASWLAQTLAFDGAIRVHALPNLWAINVELVGWLGAGVAANLRPDPQAKGLAECLRAVIVHADERLDITSPAWPTPPADAP